MYQVKRNASVSNVKLPNLNNISETNSEIRNEGTSTDNCSVEINFKN